MIHTPLGGMIVYSLLHNIKNIGNFFYRYVCYIHKMELKQLARLEL